MKESARNTRRIPVTTDEPATGNVRRRVPASEEIRVDTTGFPEPAAGPSLPGRFTSGELKARVRESLRQLEK